MMQIFSAFLFIVSLLLGCDGASFNFCTTSGTNSDECLSKNIETAIRSLKSGNSEYELPPLDPIGVDAVTIDAGNAIQLVQYYTNLQVSGFSDATVEKAHYDAKKKILTITALFPKCIQAGHYDMNGALFSLPFHGNGNSTLELDNNLINCKIQFKEVSRNNEIFLKIVTFDLDIRTKKMTVNYKNLFDGNKLLADNMINLINEEWQTLYNDVKPSIDQNYARVFKDYAQKFFDKIPANKIFSN